MIADERKEISGNHLVSVNKMYYPEIGGVEVVAQRIAELGLHLFDKSTVITFNKENSMVEEEINEVHVIRLNTAYRSDPIRLSSNFGRVIRSFSSPDTVFVFHFPSVQNELFFSHSNVKGKKVCFYHSDIVGRGSAGSLYNKLVVPKFLAKMDRIIVTSPNMKQSSACLQPFLDKVDVVPLFADIKHFHYQEDNKRREILERIGAGDEAKIILYIGRFGRYKGLDYLIKALALLPENYLLVLVGDGPERPIVETLTHELNLERRVLRFDHVPYSDLPKYYSAADVFVLPSIDRGEAFGLVVVEAMACGVPVVTTELGTGTSFHNIDGVTGRVVPPKDEKALADAIAKICEHEYKYDPQVIRKRAEEFSAERFDQRIKEVLEKVVREGSTAKIMTVYVDGLFYKGSGIGRYYEFLVSGLSKRGINIVTAVPERLKDSFLRQFSANSMVEPIFVPYEKFALKSFTSQSNLLRSLENKVDWFLYPHVNLPMFVPKNTIVTVHDLIPLTAYWDGSKVKASFFRSLVSRAVRKAYRIIAVSETTKSQLVTMFPRSKDKTVVIYESYEERLGRIASTLDKRSVDGSYFLYVGNRKRHKNLGRVIEALSRISDKSIKFVIAGQKDGTGPDEIETQVKDLNLEHRVLFFVNPSDEDLASLYKNARFLIQPSLIEGFGLPPLEALSLGTPVLLSDIPIFREIYEDAAEYFDPFSVEDIAQKIVKWSDGDAGPALHKERVAHVLAKFNREKILDQYVTLLRG